MHYYQEANKIKEHPIRTKKIERLRPIVDQLNSILPKIEKELPEFAPPSKGLRKLDVPSYHPISTSLHDYILRKIEDYHDTFEYRRQPDSTLYFYPLRISSLPDTDFHMLICRMQFQWWKSDYIAAFYIDNQGHVIDMPFANRSVENILVEGDGDYILSTSYHPKGHGHWMIYTMYKYNMTDKQVEWLADFPKFYSGHSKAPAFYSHIYIQDDTYRIKYGEFDKIMLEEEDPIGDIWLYRRDSINTIRVPRAYDDAFQLYKKSDRFQLLEHIEFY